MRRLSWASGLLLALSAHTLPALARWVAALRDWLAGPAVDLASLVRTDNTGRRALPIRAAFVVRDVDDARAQLAAWSPGPHQAGQGEPEIRAVFAAVGTRLLGEAMPRLPPRSPAPSCAPRPSCTSRGIRSTCRSRRRAPGGGSP